eukprot:6295492-Amphidinium_carterae.1
MKSLALTAKLVSDYNSLFLVWTVSLVCRGTKLGAPVNNNAADYGIVDSSIARTGHDMQRYLAGNAWDSRVGLRVGRQPGPALLHPKPPNNKTFL